MCNRMGGGVEVLYMEVDFSVPLSAAKINKIIYE